MIDVKTVRTSVERVRSALFRIVHGPPPVQWVDVGAAAIIVILGASQIVQRSPSWWPTNLLLVPACVALVLARRSPVLLGTFAAAAGVALIVTDEAQTLCGLALIVAATYVCARTARFNWPVVLPVLVAAVFSPDTGYAPLAAALVGTALGVARQSHAAASWLQQRASTLEDITEEQRATQVGLEERNALARELHNIVGHHVTAVVVLAEAAQAGTELDPAVLPRIADTARAALGELDTLVTSLRQADGVPETTAASRLVDVPELLGPLEHAGINAAVHVEISSQVGEGLQLTAYRIIQECLTNVMRHAYAHTVRVVVGVETDGRIGSPSTMTVPVRSRAGEPRPGPGRHRRARLRPRGHLVGVAVADRWFARPGAVASLPRRRFRRRSVGTSRADGWFHGPGKSSSPAGSRRRTRQNSVGRPLGW